MDSYKTRSDQTLACSIFNKTRHTRFRVELCALTYAEREAAAELYWHPLLL